MLVGISLSIKFYNELQSNNVNLIIVHNLFTNSQEKMFYCYSKISSLQLIAFDTYLVGCDQERSLEIFSLIEGEEKYCHIFEKTNNQMSADNQIKLTYKLKLPSYVSEAVLDYHLVKIEKVCKENSSKLYILDIEGNIIVYDTYANLINSDINNSNNPLKRTGQYKLKTQIERIFSNPNQSSLRCFDFLLSKNNCTSFYDNIFLLNNFGLCKAILKGKENILINLIHNNSVENQTISCFDVSDTGLIIISFSDFAIKILDEENLNLVFQTYVGTLSPETTISKIYFANIICKNENRKLVRKSLIANFYLITSKNEFLIYDMNQKTKSEIKKIKKKLELGQKKGLSKRNSLMVLSDSLFTDYSNYIVQSSNKEGKVEFYKLSLRKQFYEINNIKSINDKILDKISK